MAYYFGILNMVLARFGGYFWFSYFAVGKGSLLARGFETTGR
ncbi:hypothetical protein [Candidatus Roseilinea sp. NK_OTU-006]|nr:hypothetical protein [Candidatus Roseilinea sp. NK_OTU-006]